MKIKKDDKIRFIPNKKDNKIRFIANFDYSSLYPATFIIDKTYKRKQKIKNILNRIRE